MADSIVSSTAGFNIALHTEHYIFFPTRFSKSITAAELVWKSRSHSWSILEVLGS